MLFGYFFYPFTAGLFSGLAIFAIFSAWCMLLMRQTVYCLLALAACFLATTLLYLLVGLEYVALAYIIVYMGAILVLFLFVVMLVDLQREQSDVRFSSLVIVVGMTIVLAEFVFLPAVFLPSLYLVKYSPIFQWLNLPLRMEYLSDAVTPFSVYFYNYNFHYLVIVTLLLFIVLIGVVIMLRFIVQQEARVATVFSRDIHLKLLNEIGLVRSSS